MDRERMAMMHEKLKLADEGKGAVVEIEDGDLDEFDKSCENMAVCKVMSGKTIAPEHFKNAMPKIWNLEERVSIHRAGRNLFMCNFENKNVKRRILRNSPWSFDKALLVFEEPRATTILAELEFRYASFWLHFHRIPLACFTEKTAMGLGNCVGVFEKVDLEDERSKGFVSLRTRVRVDILEPLWRAVRVKVGSKGEEIWSPISYERLPDFCYGCGKVGHVIKDCEDCEDVEEMEFGGWLREPKRVKKNSNFGDE